MAGSRSYVICAVQRTGSWFLCHALQDSGLAGIPAEYFNPFDEPFWRDRWGVSGDFAAYLQAARREQVTPNGVFGTKVMWDYFAPMLARLRALASFDNIRRADQLLEAALPNLRFIWLRREDKLRQAISWWRADTTGNYGNKPERDFAPEFDYGAVRRLHVFAEQCEGNWLEWFADHGVRPFEVVYEDLVQRREEVVSEILDFLEIEAPKPLSWPPPRSIRQADASTEAYVASYRADPRNRRLDG